MKWYRFLNQQDQVCYGHDLTADNTIQLLLGNRVLATPNDTSAKMIFPVAAA